MTPEREEIFNDGVLERLARANRDYLNTHAEYIVPLAEMLLEAREALAVLGRQLADERELREQIEDQNWPYEWQVATAEREKRKEAEQRLAIQSNLGQTAVRSAERRLAEKDEALRSILDVTTRWSAKMSLENQIALIDMLAREALRAEPAKEEA